MSELKFGEGRISGILAVFLGLLSLGGVFCFLYPEIFTTPHLRAVYPVELLRRLLSFVTGLAFTFGIVSFILSKNKTYSFFGISLSLIATGLGGSTIKVPENIGQQNYIGLDWFILDIFVVALVFVPLERIWTLKKNQLIFRKEWKTDFYHFLFSHLLVQITSFLILAPALLLSTKFTIPSLQSFVRGQSLFIQFLEIVFIADLTQYWVHRGFHQIPFLWKFHAIHHSSQEMDWLAGSRLHFIDIVVTRGLTLIPLFLLGFDQKAMAAYLIFVAFLATFIHVNANFRMRWLTSILATPIYHHWHHAAEKEAIDKNFAVHIPILDKIFGTYYLPDRWPSKYGLLEQEVPSTYWEQTLEPFRFRK